jgi:hypothetical protein
VLLLSFSKLGIRDFKKLIDELCFFVSNNRRVLISRDLTEIAEGSSVGRELQSIIVGSFELLVAVALSKLLGLALYTRSRSYIASIEEGEFLLWNGVLTEENGYLVPYMSGQGVPDIEVHYGKACTLVEVTLGTSYKTLLYEIHEAVSHNPTMICNVNERVVLAPLLGEKLLELARYARDYHSVKLHVLSIYTLIEYLCTNKSLESILELGPFNHNPFNHNSVKELCMRGVNEIEEVIKQLVNNERGLGQLAERMRGMGYMIIPALVYKMYSLLNSGIQRSPSFNSLYDFTG